MISKYSDTDQISDHTCTAYLKNKYFVNKLNTYHGVDKLSKDSAMCVALINTDKNHITFCNNV